MRILVAFDKFKDALSASDACAIAARALAALPGPPQLDLCPLTDGGEGFAAILTRAAGGEFESVSVNGPRREPVNANIGRVSLDRIPAAAQRLLSIGTRHSAFGNSIALIEMSAASGLALLPPELRDPWQTTTLGAGELIRAAAHRNVAAIVLGIGGSATNDLGLGALTALGFEFRAADGQLVFPIPAAWDRITRITGRIDANLPSIRIACDVSNPLLGPRGCAAVYGPQKGLRASDLPRLEHAAARLALQLCHHCGQPDTLMDAPGAGAAGGISFGLMAAANAKLLPGFDLVQAWLDLESRVAAADLVITGEGRFDDTSLQGKGPAAVALRAAALGKRVHVFAGAIATTAAPPAAFALHAITPVGTPLPIALRDTAAHLAASLRREFSPAP